MDRTVLISLLLCASIACGDDAVPTPTIEIAVTASDILSDDLLAGTEVCVTRPSGYGCQTTDAAGTAHVMAPANSEVLLRFTKELYYPALNMVSTGDANAAIEADIPTISAVTLTISLTPDGMTIPGKGQMIALFSPDGPSINLSGITVGVTPGTHTPLYFNESMVPDPTLMATTETAIVAFANLDPGEYSMAFVHATIGCSGIESGWSTADPKTLRFAIEADTVTILQLLGCQ